MPADRSSDRLRAALVWENLEFRHTRLKTCGINTQKLARLLRRLYRDFDAYLATHPAFETALKPLPEDPQAPETIKRMLRASALCEVGPMAAVAGTVAQTGVDSLGSAAGNFLINNGGDLYLRLSDPVTIGLFTGKASSDLPLALQIAPEMTPLAVCSSSGIMGHSHSEGRADLATVLSPDGALADAAATRGCNLVQSASDLSAAAETIAAIPGVTGVLLAKDGRVALAGELPPLVKRPEGRLSDRIVFAPGSDYAE